MRSWVASLLLLAAHPVLAQGPPAVRWAVLASGGGAAGGGAVAVVDALGEAALGNTAPGAASLAGGFLPGALLDADETACALPAGLAAGTYDFHLTSRVGVEVAAPGTLGCLRIRRVASSAPGWIPGIETGRYWVVTGTDSSGGTATGFQLAMTVPFQSMTAEPHLCRWAAARWDCARTSLGATTVTRAGITALSDWAVGDGPVPVTLFWFTAD